VSKNLELADSNASGELYFSPSVPQVILRKSMIWGLILQETNSATDVDKTDFRELQLESLSGRSSIGRALAFQAGC
jgi:hypothetical protein